MLDRLLVGQRRLVLAVSGGLDSMCLLHLVAGRRRGATEVSVATFDHRSGPASQAAVAHVLESAAALAVPVHVGAAARPAATEAEWREARWAFLRETAATHDAVIVTAHTADDHLETVIMRILRGAGARGLAGLLAPSPGVARPLVAVSRQALEDYARETKLLWVEDPTNASRRFLRNRVRLDLLPALCRANPGFPEALLALSERAAAVRREVDRLSTRWEGSREGATLSVDHKLLTQLGREERALVWQSILARHGIVLDRRGLTRLSQLDATAPTGFRLQLSGGMEAMRLREEVVLQPFNRHSSPAVAIGAARPAVFGPWVFRLGEPCGEEGRPEGDRPWETWVPADAELVVREWTPGDRLAGGPDRMSRRVTRFLADVGVAGPERRGWPVVVAEGEIVWIPGVRRAHAAPARSGRPVRRLVCERLSR